MGARGGGGGVVVEVVVEATNIILVASKFIPLAWVVNFVVVET